MLCTNFCTALHILYSKSPLLCFILFAHLCSTLNCTYSPLVNALHILHRKPERAALTIILSYFCTFPPQHWAAFPNLPNQSATRRKKFKNCSLKLSPSKICALVYHSVCLCIMGWFSGYHWVFLATLVALHFTPVSRSLSHLVGQNFELA